MDNLIYELLLGQSACSCIDKLLEAVCPSCGNKNAYVNLRGAVDCPSRGCVHSKASSSSKQKPFLQLYNRWVAAGGGHKGRYLRDTLNAVADWVKLQSFKDVTTAHKVLKQKMEKGAPGKGSFTKIGLGLDFSGIYDSVEGSPYPRIGIMFEVKTKSLRSGSPGGDPLGQVVFKYYIDGTETIELNMWSSTFNRLSLPTKVGYSARGFEAHALSHLLRALPNKLPFYKYDFRLKHKKLGIKLP